MFSAGILSCSFLLNLANWTKFEFCRYERHKGKNPFIKIIFIESTFLILKFNSKY